MKEAIRRAGYRLGRRLYTEARGDVRNDPRTNGEYSLLEHVMTTLAIETPSPVFVDVGANVGDWSWTTLRASAARGLSPTVHAIEPAEVTFRHLRERFVSTATVQTHRLAMGRMNGAGALVVDGALAGTNTLSDRGSGAREQVTIATFDSFCSDHAIGRVCMVKTDTEGFDFAVMQGARESLAERRIGLWQFEYNSRWLDDRAYLRDVFDFAASVGCLVGRVMRGGYIEQYDSWHPELERFFEANYCLVPRGGTAETYCRKVRFDRNNTPIPAESQADIPGQAG